MNAKDKISEVTGLKPSVIDAVFEEVKQNHKKMDTCPHHDFSIVLDRHSKQRIDNPTPQQLFGAKFQCTRCGGIVDGIERLWYTRGLRHGYDS